MSLLLRLAGMLPRDWIKAVGRMQWRHPWLKRAVEWSADRLRRQDGVIPQGVGRGLRFNAGGANAGYLLGTTEPLMQEALAAVVRPGMCVLDAGANVGFFSVLAARLTGPSGCVIAFEPVEANARLAEHNASLNGFAHLSVRRVALGRADGEAAFRVSAVPTWGKLAHVGVVEDEVGTITVAVRSLDSLATEPDFRKPDVIKIDVEGAECDVLAGGRALLAAARPLLLIELHGTNAAVADLLDEAGYDYRVLGGEAPIRESPWDAQILATPR